MNAKIKDVYAREILDSRGNPTIEVIIGNGTLKARAAVPSGASTGTNEALELRDEDPKRYNNKGVLEAVSNVNKIISKAVKGMDCTKQNEIDSAMIKLDGTENKSKLGANAILGVSLAAARLNALCSGKELYATIAEINMKKLQKILPIPFMNIINGGKHADNKLQFQEFMIAPHAKTFAERLRIGAEVYHVLKGVIGKKYGKSSTNVGDEGGFAPNVQSAEEALNLVMDSIETAGYKKEVKLALDAAASEFYDKLSKEYNVEGRSMSIGELSDLYKKLVKDFPIISIEDPFFEESFDDFARLKKALGSKVQIVGDDLLVTNVKRISMALKKDACSALLLKVNQIGTLSESMDAANLAMKNSWNVMISHRSGETCDAFIADLAVGLGTGQIKSGAPCRGERLSKYNRLLEIEQEHG